MTSKDISKEQQTGQPESILLIEDDVGLQRQMSWALADYKVSVASARQEADL